MKKERSVVLVSGASSGLGKAVSEFLYEKGFNVYAGARSFKEETTEKREGSSGCLHRVNLDVTDPSSAKKLIERIKNDEGRIDVLINCAVHLVLGSVEDTSIDEYRGVLETGFFGDLNMIKGVLPVMRSQNNGLIINFSSINGVLGIPFQSAYVSLKFAIEGLTECLSLEVKDFGIDVVMLEPSDHRSGSKAYRPHAKLADSTNSAYYQRYKKVTGKISHDEETGSFPVGLAALIYKIILKQKPKLRYTVGKFDQRLSVVLKKILPGRLFEKVIYSYYYGGKDPK